MALATVRSVLDPAKRYEPDHFIVSTRESIGLDLKHITIDVETFITEAAAGFEALSMGDFSVAKGHLMAAETTYAGDFLEQDAYVDWAVPLREEARNIYARVARTLAREAMKNSDPGSAQNYLLRILERDPFDEEAHLELISALTASRRHGEARRAYRNYCTRMKVIGVEAASFPGTDLERTVRS